MLLTTFDSNVWRPIADPSRFPKDPQSPAFTCIHDTLRAGKIEGRLSETVFTLEGIARADRKQFLANYQAAIGFTEGANPDGTLTLGISIGPDRSAHPGNNPYLTSHLKDALSVGIKLMHCPRLAGVINPDLQEAWFVPAPTSISNFANTFGEVVRKIDAAGVGITHIKAIGTKYVAMGQTWFDALINAPPADDGIIAKAVAEWADGDSIAAHIAYGNHYFCTRDLAVGSGVNSVFSADNRNWIEVDYGVRFVTPEELAALL